jgi:translation initiation factor IF-1
LTIVDRTFIRGDYVRKSSEPNRGTGTVVQVETQVKLEDAFNHTPLDAWVSSEMLVNYVRISRGDHVAFGEWIGVVEEVLEEAMLQFVDGAVERVADLGSGLLQPGDTGEVRYSTIPLLLW